MFWATVDPSYSGSYRHWFFRNKRLAINLAIFSGTNHEHVLSSVEEEQKKRFETHEIEFPK